MQPLEKDALRRRWGGGVSEGGPSAKGSSQGLVGGKPQEGMQKGL